MKKRRYNQYCGVAQALDLIGERWTLLVVRELLLGPKRYTDLLESLPGIGTNILAARLQELEQASIIQRRVLPPPAASTVYELTAYGRELDEIIMLLGRWGGKSLEPPQQQAFRGESAMLALRSSFRSATARDVSATFEFHFAPEEVFTVRLLLGSLEVVPGSAHHPDVIVDVTTDVFFQLLTKQLSLKEALERDQIHLQGDADLLASALFDHVYFETGVYIPSESAS